MRGRRLSSRPRGRAIGRRPLVDALLRSGKLKAPFRNVVDAMHAYFVIVEPAARSRPGVRALEAWLLAQGAATISLNPTRRRRN